jgi:hypothetical protein
MSDMKLIMEGWRRFVVEQETTQDLGPLYIFENDTVAKVSFSDRLNMLNESDGDLLLFVEQWERSAEHVLETLEEGLMGQLKLFGSNPIGFLLTQAFHLIEKLKQIPGLLFKGMKKVFAIAGKVIGLSGSLREKHPRLAKLGFIMGTSITMFAAATLMQGIPDALAGDFITNSGELIATAAELKEDAAYLKATAGDLAKELSQLPDSADPEMSKTLTDSIEVFNSTADKMEQIANNPEDQSIIDMGPRDSRSLEHMHNELEKIRAEVAQEASDAADAASGVIQMPRGISIDTEALEITVDKKVSGRSLDLANTVAEPRARWALKEAGINVTDLQRVGDKSGMLDDDTLRITFKYTIK